MPGKRKTFFECPECGTRDQKVMDSRETNRGELWLIRRRRACEKCDFRFTTYEVSQIDFEKLLTSDERMKVILQLLHAAISEPEATPDD